MTALTNTTTRLGAYVLLNGKAMSEMSRIMEMVGVRPFWKAFLKNQKYTFKATDYYTTMHMMHHQDIVPQRLTLLSWIAFGWELPDTFARSRPSFILPSFKSEKQTIMENDPP
jgi:hypothetical protein